MPEELANRPELDPLIVYLWNYFLELHNERGSNGFGVNPIQSRDIVDWQRTTGNRLHPWEVRAIKKADEAFRIVQNEISASKAKGTP